MYFVILAGGFGTRFGNLTKSVPKPAILLNGKPIIFYLLDWCEQNNIKNIIISGGYKYDYLIRLFKNQKKIKLKEKINNFHYVFHTNLMNIRLIYTGLESGTFERLAKIKEHLIKFNTFSLTYADTLTNLNFNRVLNYYKKKDCSICFTAGFPDARYGEINFDLNYKVIKFKEKERPKFLVNRGFMIIKSKIFSDKKIDKYISIEKDLIPYYVKKNEVYLYKSNAKFYSIDTEYDLQNLNKLNRKNKILKCKF